jgi:multidrug efflux pump subunit AcrA (membrane-fusion protein)
MRLPLVCTLTLLLTPAVRAAESGEITVDPRPFTIRHSVSASVVPAEFTTIRLEAEVWQDYEITQLAPHAAQVAKGAVLLAFDAEKIDEKIADTRRAIANRARAIVQAEHELKNLRDTTPHRLDALRRAAEEAKEEHAYFTATRRKSMEESAAQKLRRAEIFLENQSEELRQLEKMYAADDLTEETEEIILHRQRDRVKTAEFELRMERLNHQRQIDVMLPREVIKLADAERDAAIALAKFEDESPRLIAQAEFELESLRVQQTREEALLVKLEADRKSFDITAPDDGWFFHAAIENQRWLPADSSRSLVVHGKAATRRPLATFIPGKSGMRLVANLDPAIARQIDGKPRATAWFDGREDSGIDVELAELSPTPSADGSQTAVFTAPWPDGFRVLPAATARITFITHHAPSAIVLPVKALRFDPDGWTVAVKLADGKTERRPVRRGRVFNGECEILAGLEAGQVVIP